MRSMRARAGDRSTAKSDLAGCQDDGQAPSDPAGRALVSRLLPGYDDQIDVVKIPPEEGNDVFELVG
jgi:hypothetical protein